jgi:cytochrome c2
VKPIRCCGRAAVWAFVLSLCPLLLARTTTASGLRGPEVVAPGGLHAVGPPLTALRTKLADPNWLVAWLLKPSRLRQPPLMRNFNIKVRDAQAIAKYLLAAAPTESTVPWQGGDRALGKTLFVTRGCRGCHAIERGEQSVSPRVPNLAGIGLKVRGDWLFNWLKSPRSYNPDTAMPQLNLDADEIRNLVAFLLTRREGAAVVAAAPRFDPHASLDAARVAIGRFDCPKCHLIDGFQTVAPTSPERFMPHGCSTCHEPAHASRPAEPLVQDSAALDNGRMLVAYYNCRGCHRIEATGGDIAAFLERKSFVPPSLDGEGARVQTSWLVDFLRHPKRLRPWLQLQMPDFGLSDAEASALADYFAALAHIPAADEPTGALPAQTVAFGQHRFAHFKCLQCHPTNRDAQLPEGVDPEDVSINLMLAKGRLRPSWVRDFLARPKAVVGLETRMPAVFYTSDGVPKVEAPEADIAAITAYLFQMTEVAPPSDGGGPHEQPTDTIDWTKHPY